MQKAVVDSGLIPTPLALNAKASDVLWERFSQFFTPLAAIEKVTLAQGRPLTIAEKAILPFACLQRRKGKTPWRPVFGLVVIEPTQTLVAMDVVPSVELPPWITHYTKIDKLGTFVGDVMAFPPSPYSMIVIPGQGGLVIGDLFFNVGDLVSTSEPGGKGVFVDHGRVGPLRKIIGGLPNTNAQNIYRLAKSLTSLSGQARDRALDDRDAMIELYDPNAVTEANDNEGPGAKTAAQKSPLESATKPSETTKPRSKTKAKNAKPLPLIPKAQFLEALEIMAEASSDDVWAAIKTESLRVKGWPPAEDF